jgi:hypothetical protein
VNETVGGHRYNIYVGASGTWVNKGDGGWINWAVRTRWQRSQVPVRYYTISKFVKLLIC